MRVRILTLTAAAAISCASLAFAQEALVTGIAADETTVYWAASYADEILSGNPGGGSPAKTLANLPGGSTPYGIAVDREGCVYVVDSGNNRILKYVPTDEEINRGKEEKTKSEATSPAPPPSNPFDWGDVPRVRELLGEAFELELEEHVSTLRVPSGEDYWDLFSTSYGPTKTLADSLGDRREELHRECVEFFESNYRANGEIAHTREYLLIVGTRR